MPEPIIMVDELRPYPRARHRCFRAGACHLTVDGESPEHIEALHAFARRLGMKRAWFQDHRLAPHYDLTKSKRERALQLGATFVPAREQARVRIARRDATTQSGLGGRRSSASWASARASTGDGDRSRPICPRARCPGESCPGEGACHGCQTWCEVCGDVRFTCDDRECDEHSEAGLARRGIERQR